MVARWSRQQIAAYVTSGLTAKRPGSAPRLTLINRVWDYFTYVNTSGPVSTGMGDRSGVQLPVPELIAVYNRHPVQLSLAILPWVGAIEYQPKGSDALQLGNRGRYGSCVSGR